MPESTIRAYRPGDSDSIINLIIEYRAEGAGTTVDKQAVKTTLACFDASKQDRIFVAEQENKIVGYVAFHLVPFPMLQGTEGYISDLIVDGSARGSGIGGLLVQAVEDEARHCGCVRLTLNNHKTAVSYTRGFYPKRAYQERKDFANFVKPLA